jgi:hypothetical protein
VGVTKEKITNSVTTGNNSSVCTFTSAPIYRNFSLILLFLIFVTLLPHYEKIYDSSVQVSFQLVLHAILYLGWYILFSIQSHLVSFGNKTLHRKLGYLSVFLFGLLVFSGIDMLLGVMQSYDSHWDQGKLISRASFVWGILHTLVAFTGFYVLGLVFRKNSHYHKRFMLMASLSMVSASVTRIAFHPAIPIDGMVITLLSTYGFLFAPLVIDRMTFNGVHPALKWSVPIYIVTQILCIGLMPATRIGQAIAFPF